MTREEFNHLLSTVGDETRDADDEATIARLEKSGLTSTEQGLVMFGLVQVRQSSARVIEVLMAAKTSDDTLRVFLEELSISFKSVANMTSNLLAISRNLDGVKVAS